MPDIKLYCFGPPRLERAGRPVEIGRRKTLALLVYLAVTGQPHSREALAALLWPEADGRTSRANLRRSLYLLGQALGPGGLELSAETVQLHPELDLWVDVQTFQRALAGCLPSGRGPEAAAIAGSLLAGCRERLAAGVAGYRADFLAGFSLPDSPAFDEWQFFQGESLRADLGRALVALAGEHAAAGDWEAAIGFTRRWLALDPLHEPAHRLLMELYARAGQHSAALRQYELTVRTLEKELGLAPEPETIALYEQIRLSRGTAEPGPARGGTQAAAAAHGAPAAAPRGGAPDGDERGRASRADVSETANPPLGMPQRLVSPPPNLAMPVWLTRTGESDRALIDRSSSAWLAPTPRHNLPAQLTPFLGREAELTEIQRLLNAPGVRLLSLTGPGGIGKTRLAGQAALRLAGLDGAGPPQAGPAEAVPAGQEFPDGVWFVPLASLENSEGLAQAIAAALDLRFSPEGEMAERQLLAHLHGRRLLLVLDNFEQLLEAGGARLVAGLLSGAPGIKILATSRARLNIQGEQLLPVGGLPVPDSQEAARWQDLRLVDRYSALRLFESSARRVRPDFTLSPETLPHAARICALVQGMPLGIELAAAWMEVISPAEIAAEIERCLDFLEAGWQDLPERQRSLRAVFEASWKLLSPAEREALGRLSVFRGGFTRAVAESVAGATPRLLLALTSKSWLQPGAGEDGDHARYGVHELLRQYASETLQADPAGWQAARDRHADHFAAFVSAQSDRMKGPEQKEAFAAVAADIDNIRHAWRWLVERQRYEQVMHLLKALYGFLLSRPAVLNIEADVEAGYQAVASHDSPLDRRPLLASLRTLLSWLYLRTRQESAFGLEKTYIQEAWSLASDETVAERMGFWALLMAEMYARLVDRAAGLARLSQLLDRLREEGETWVLAHMLTSLALLLRDLHRREEARALLLEALGIHRLFGAYNEQANTLRILSLLCIENGDLEGAEAFLEAALELAELSGDPHARMFILYETGNLRISQGRYAEGFAVYQAMRRSAAEIGAGRVEAAALSTESMEALRYGSIERALEARREALAVAERDGDPNGIGWSYWELGEIYRVSGDLGAARDWYERARGLFAHHRVEMGLAFYARGLGDLALAAGQPAEAYGRFHEYLAIARKEHFDWSVVYARCGLGRAALALGRPAEAGEQLLAGLAEARQLGNRGLALAVMAGLAGWLLATGQAGAAARLGAFVRGDRAAWRATRAQAEATLAAAEARLPVGAFEAARTAGERAAFDDLAAELLEAGAGAAAPGLGY